MGIIIIVPHLVDVRSKGINTHKRLESLINNSTNALSKYYL